MSAMSIRTQYPGSEAVTVRFREAGDVTLDLVHHDGRVDDCWLGLNPHEFALLWRLAEQPGACISRQLLLADVWRLPCATDHRTLSDHVDQMRDRMKPFGLDNLIAADRDGGYFLNLRSMTGVR